jgi:hypothetical protein
VSWLSQGLSDIGLGGINTFFNSAIKPALENPIVDVGLGLGAAALTGGLASGALGGLFGATTAADSLGGAAAAGAGADAAAAAAPTALGFAGDVDPFAAATFAPSADVPPALASGFAGNTLSGGFLSAGTPSLASSVSAAAPDLSSAFASTGDYLTGSAFDPSTWTGATAGATPTAGTPSLATSVDQGLGTFEGNINTIANSSFGSPGVNPLTTSTGGATEPGKIATSLSNLVGGAVSPSTLSTIGSTLGPAAGIGGLGYNLYQGYQQKQQLNALINQENAQAANAQQVSQQEQAAAAPLLSQGNTLINYLTTNTLPTQFQTQIQQNVAAAQAAIIQGYATRGMSTDPSQNSALAQDLANVNTQAQALQANLESTLASAGQQLTQQANQLLQSGISATQLSAEIPIMVQKLNSQINSQTASAISSFASAFGGGGKPGNLTLQVAQAA